MLALSSKGATAGGTLPTFIEDHQWSKLRVQEHALEQALVEEKFYYECGETGCIKRNCPKLKNEKVKLELEKSWWERKMKFGNHQ